MKKIIFITLLTFICLQSYSADSARISTHRKVTIKTDPSRGYTNYPAWGEFPDAATQYRKVYLYLEFGCAPGLNCGEWDYINQILIGGKGGVNGDTLGYEICRFITPYGNYWKSSDNWKHGWYFDLTDYSHLLHDSVELIYQHTGYEGNSDRGWTVTMDIVCVKGDPARIPMGVDLFYQKSITYGNASSPFKNAVPDKQFIMPSGADRVNFKTIQTGHGFNTTENCSEFCAKKRTIKLDNTTISEKVVWRDDCGMNSLYPQAGTWLYDRAGWCPGAPVHPSDVYVPLAAGSQHSFSLDMEAYTNTQGNANYSLTTYAQYFKDNTKTNDAAIDDILAPSSHLDYLRMNPTCGSPIIRVKNMGSATITSLEIEYGKLGGSLQKATLTCDIKPFETQVLTLDAVSSWRGSGSIFTATITRVNGQTDEYTADNSMQSKITNSVSFPNKIYIVFKSNSAPSENYYTIKDNTGKVVFSRSNFTANKIFRDTIYLHNNLCYTFEFFDDGEPPAGNPLNRDGLDWWANTDDGSGYIQIRNGNSNAMLKNFAPDFGTKQMLNFYTTFTMDNKAMQSDASSIQVDIAPNPGHGGTSLYLDLSAEGEYAVDIYDMTGKVVFSKTGNSLFETIVLEGLVPGMYTARVMQGGQTAAKKFVVD
jgi:hypothetical protein